MSARSALLLALAAGCAHAQLPPPPPPPAPPATEAVGHVDSVDPYAHRLSVSTHRGELSLVAGRDAELVDDSGVGWLQLRDLHPGDEVRVDWRARRDGALELTSLRLLPARGDPAPTEPIPPPRDDEAPLETPAGGLAPNPVGGR